MSTIEDYKEQVIEQNRRAGLIGAAWTFCVLGFVAIMFTGILAARLSGRDDVETFDDGAAAVALVAMPYGLAGVVLICSGVIGLAVLTGPLRKPDFPSDLDRPPSPQD